MTTSIDWRRPENRREAFQRFYTFHLQYKAHPGLVYSFLPAIAEAAGLDDAGRAWLAWLNGNTQNPATSLLLLEAAPTVDDFERAIDVWDRFFKELEWDTDRRYQKGRFGEATREWVRKFGDAPHLGWLEAGMDGWSGTWKYATSQPYMGRLSAWSMTEFARILLGPDVVPDADTWYLKDKKGSQSHRNGIALVAGYNSTFWDPDTADVLGIVEELEEFADGLLSEARARNHGKPSIVDWHVGRLTMESALCTYKSWHKPNRRYPGVYADMAYYRIRRAEKHFGGRFGILWEARRNDLPEFLRLEDNPLDPGLVPEKQNHYRETGEVIQMHHNYPDMTNEFAARVLRGEFGERER